MGYTITPAPPPTYGLSSQRPTTGTPGAFYFETDTKKTYQYDGGWKFLSVIPDQSWIAPTLLNGWVNFGAQYPIAGYRRHSTGQVEIRGLVMNGTIGGSIFTLPVGYRPAYEIIHDTQSGGTLARLDITGAGAVVLVAANNSAYASIDINFYADL